MAHRGTPAAVLLSAALLTFGPLSNAHAAAPPRAKPTPETSLHRIQRTVAKINAEARTPEGEAVVVKRLSAQLGASPDSLRQQHAAWGLGYGEIAMAYGFAKASRKGRTPADVVAMRGTGMEWLAIAKDLGVKVDQVASRMRRHVGPAKGR
jgi:hypothetical protein